MPGMTQVIVTPSGPLTLLRPAAARLLADGVISGTLDGTLHAADATTVKAAIMATNVCDFCSGPGALKVYDVPDFGLSLIPGSAGGGRSTGGWAACETCQGLIEADKRPGARMAHELEAHDRRQPARMSD